jgi:hypothetical protein
MSIPTLIHKRRTRIPTAACLALLATAAEATGTGGGSGGDPKPGLAARVEALEAQNARQRSRIRQLEGRPNVAGKACPQGLALVGFGSDGTLICEAPWASTTPGPNAHLRCLEHFDPGATSQVLNNFLNTNIIPFLRDYALQWARGSAELEDGTDFSYEIQGGLWTPQTPFVPAVQLVELRMEEPCVDAVRVVIWAPELTAEGVAALDLGALGNFYSKMQVEIRDVVLEFLVPLSNPDLEGTPVGTTADRIPLPFNANATLVSGEVVVTVDDTHLGDFPEIAGILSDAYEPQLRDEMVDLLVEQIRAQLSPTLRSPVTLQVVAVP